MVTLIGAESALLVLGLVSTFQRMEKTERETIQTKMCDVESSEIMQNSQTVTQLSTSKLHPNFRYATKISWTKVILI